MPSSLKLIVAGLAALVVAGLVLHHGAAVTWQDAAHVQVAAQDQSDARAAAAQSNAYARQAQALAGPIWTDARAVSRFTAHVDQLARLQVPPRHRPGPVADPMPQSGPALDAPADPAGSLAPPAAAVSPLDLAKDQLIAAQVREIADLKAQNAQLAQEAGAARQAYRCDDTAVGELGKAVHPNYTRAAGLVYGPGQQAYGVCVDQDISRVRLGVDVLAQQLPATAGGRVQSLALIRAEWRF